MVMFLFAILLQRTTSAITARIGKNRNHWLKSCQKLTERQLEEAETASKEAIKEMTKMELASFFSPQA